MSILKRSERSTLWWMQKSATVLVCLILSVAVLRFVWLANVDVVAIGLDMEPEFELSPVELNSNGDLADEEASGLSGISINPGDKVHFALQVEATGRKQVPTGILKRCRWLLLRQDGRVWKNEPTLLQMNSRVSATLIADQAGRFLVIATLPPVKPQNLIGVGSVELDRLLSGSDHERIAIVHVTVKGSKANKNASKEDPQQQEAPGPDESVPQETKPAPPAPSSTNAIPTPAELSVPEPTSEPVVKADLRTSQKGDEDKSPGVKDQNDAELENSNANEAVQKTVHVPPRREARTVSSALAKAKMDGALPQLNLSIRPPGFSNLDKLDWWTLVRRYNMPLVLLPKAEFARFYDGIPVVYSDARVEVLPAEEIERRYGRFPVDVQSLSPEIQAETKELAGVGLWIKSRRQLFFLGDAMLLPFEEVLSRGEALDGIKQITAVLGITNDGKAGLEVESLSIDRTKGGAE